MNVFVIVCILSLCLYLILVVLWIVSSIINIIDDWKRKKRDAKWEVERQQLERKRSLREIEYHEARTKDFNKK